MPTYEFECKKCEEHFSLSLSFSEFDKKKRVKCPSCGSTATRRLYSSFFAKTSKKS